MLLQSLVDWLLADPTHLVAIASALAAIIPTPAAQSNAGKLFQIVDLLALNVLHAKETGTGGQGGGTPPGGSNPASAMALTAALAACAGQSPAATLFETRAAYDATVLAPLVRYHALPACPTATGVCKEPDVDRQLILADADAKTALDAAEDVIRFHPGTDPASAVQEAQVAVAAIQTILIQHGVK